VTIPATGSGNSLRSSTRTYPRSTIVEIVAAYVDGRPMPCSSRALMRDASVNRGGGSVKCCVV
jgi:hypothetical protein